MRTAFRNSIKPNSYRLIIRQFATKNGLLLFSIIAFCFFTLSLIWVNYLNQKKNDKAETIASAVQRNTNLAIALEQYTIRTIHNADAVLQLVKMEYHTNGSTIDINKLLFDNAVNRDIFKGIGIIDKEGVFIAVNLKVRADNTLKVSDRDYFQYHAHNNNDVLFISKPVISKTIGKPVIVVSRRINDNRGYFNGVAAVQIEPSTFTSFYAQANLHANDIISLISPDGITYARRTGNVESSGENIRKSPLFHHVANNSDSFYFAKDAIRNIPTYFSYRKLREYPMIATVGTSQEDVLKDYYKRAARDLTSAVTMSVLLLLFSGLALIIVLHRKKMAERRILEEKRYQQDLTKQVIAAQEREREEIGRELHDNVNQVLTTVKLYLETALYQPENNAKLISKSMDLIMASIQEIRNLSRELSAPTLGTKSLIDSINSLIETVAFSSGLKIYFDHSNYKNHIAMSQKLTLYRIVQEQLNNIIKHSKASQVQIMLSQSNGNTILTIKDDGKGFDPLEKREGIGLNNITSRAKIFQGMVNIQSAPGKGCSVTVNIPILVLEQD